MPMATTEYEIRLCLSCGLRYPLIGRQTGQPSCPACSADTSLVGAYPLQPEEIAPFKDSLLHLEVLIDNVPSARDIGSIFRAAYGFGVKHLYLCGITPTPDATIVRRSAVGLSKYVPWTYHKDSVLTLRALKELGYKAFGLEHDARAVSIKEVALARRRRASDVDKKNPSPQSVTLSDKVLFVVGNEQAQVDPDLLHLCDSIVFLPLRGDKKLFNPVMVFTVAIGQIVL